MLCTLAEELHFGRAAAMAQPALSVQIQTLERELDVQLLTRSTRRVQLTKPGEVSYERCIRVLKEIENSSAVVRAVAGKDVDRITIGNIYPATFGVLPLFLSKLGKRFQTFRFTSAVARPMQSSAIWRRAASISASSGRSKISARSAGRASPTNDVFWRCRLAARWRWRKLSQ